MKITKKQKINPSFWILSAAFLLHLVTLFYTIQKPEVTIFGDTLDYLKAAENLRTSGVLYSGDLEKPIDPALYSRRTLLYPLFIAFFSMIWKSNIFIILLQIGLNFLNVFLLWRILTLFNTSHKLKYVIIALYLFYPAQVIYTQIFMSEILLQTLLLFSFFFLINFLQNKRLFLLFLFNLFLTLALLTKPVLLYFWIPNLLFHLWLALHFKKRIIFLFSVIFIITALLWNYRNYQRTGYFHYSSIKNVNLFHYNTHGFLVSKYGQAHADSFVINIEQEIQGQTFASASKKVEKTCVKTLTNDWFDYSFYHFRGVIFFFIDPGRFDIAQFLGFTDRTGFLYYINKYGLKGIPKLITNTSKLIVIFLFVVAILNVLLFISFLYFIFLKIPLIEIKIFLILMITYIAVLTGPIGASRFRIVLLPYLLLTIPTVVQSIFKKQTNKTLCQKEK